MANDAANFEAQLLLSILRQSPDNFDINSINSNPESINTGDFERFIDLVFRNGLAGLIYLRVQKSSFLPEEIVERLKIGYRQTVLTNLGQVAELLEVLKIFHAHSIDLIPLKGVVDAENIFGDLGSYPSNDIDVLARERELPALSTILNKYGYYAIEEINENDLLLSHYHFVYRKKGSDIEVHWNLVKRYFSVPADFWWQGVNVQAYRGHELKELAAEKYLLYLIFRLFDHQFTPFKFFVHISEFIAQSTRFDWDKFIGCSDVVGMERLVFFTLRLVHELFGTKVPDDVCDSNITGYVFLKNLVLAQNFNNRCTPHLAMLYFSCLLLPPQSSIKVILSRIFVKKSEIRLRYGLKSNSKTVYFYMILNPLLMLFRRK